MKGIREACKDSVAMLFMFDLTSRCTLNSVFNWYQQARKYNQTAIPVMVGSKFDDFIEFPIDMQWTISSEARAYAKAINATLFFSSASYNINVNKMIPSRHLGFFGLIFVSFSISNVLKSKGGGFESSCFSFLNCKLDYLCETVFLLVYHIFSCWMSEYGPCYIDVRRK
ncbi:Mitochondrial Rho-like protein [Artemisia annua]|uniref:Mitochondrial Rho-like protein n=1 Tax=Artemisia annua TaxID=35608 RepID=A0A2U1P0D0_ARTAN|nr:Mitochondrial Rho-like protein [Artemisia annua]